jgi:hypothetical protein
MRLWFPVAAFVFLAALSACSPAPPATTKAQAAAPAACDPTRPVAVEDFVKRLEAARAEQGLPADASAAEDLRATVTALPAWSPLHPCALNPTADSAIDESGVSQISFSAADLYAVAAFYKQSFATAGIVSDHQEGPVRTVSVEKPDGTPLSTLHIQRDDDGGASIFLRQESKP